MGKEPDQLRAEIEETRERMGTTVDAIGYKADVPARTRESVVAAKDNVVGSISAAKDRVVGSIAGTRDSVAEAGRSAVGTISDATPSAQDLKRGVQRTGGLAQENPIGLAVGAMAVGFVAGVMIPASKKETETIAPIATQVRDRAMETGQEALDRGKEIAQEAASAAKDVAQQAAQTAQSTAQEKVEDIRGTAQEHTQEFASNVQDRTQDIRS